ncbi:MAG: hypothetical protein ABIQ73_10140 [Acidimicrobiales bacterium]
MSDFTNQPLPPPPPPGPPPGAQPQFPAHYPPQYPGHYPPQFPQYPQGQHPQGAYPPQMAYGFARPSHTSGLAIASMVLGILWR